MNKPIKTIEGWACIRESGDLFGSVHTTREQAEFLSGPASMKVVIRRVLIVDPGEIERLRERLAACVYANDIGDYEDDLVWGSAKEALGEKQP